MSEKVLFIDAIRRDIPSGGRTATHALETALETSREIKIMQLGIAVPTHLRSLQRFRARAMRMIESMPAPLFVLASRIGQVVWLEFFARVSFFYLVKCIWLRLAWSPDIVYLNHHASFIYGLIFPRKNRVFVYHDVPSQKNTNNQSTRAQVRKCAWIERALTREGRVVVFAYQDAVFLRRFHHKQIHLQSAVPNRQFGRAALVPSNQYILVGNWSRIENTGGALKFFECCKKYSLQKNEAGHRATKFVIAGYGAARFCAAIVRSGMGRLPDYSVESLASFDHFEHLQGAAVVAPLDRGAGIKLKTLEAWAVGFPVIGTPEAFTGLTPAAVVQGGLKMASIDDLAKFFMGDQDPLKCLVKLDGQAAFDTYVRQSDHSPLP